MLQYWFYNNIQVKYNNLINTTTNNIIICQVKESGLSSSLVLNSISFSFNLIIAIYIYI